MWFSFKRLALGITLILLTSAVLLFSDLGHRTSAHGSVVKIAILQHASSPVLDDGITGIILGLAEHGFSDGARRRYSASTPRQTWRSATPLPVRS